MSFMQIVTLALRRRRRQEGVALIIRLFAVSNTRLDAEEQSLQSQRRLSAAAMLSFGPSLRCSEQDPKKCICFWRGCDSEN